MPSLLDQLDDLDTETGNQPGVDLVNDVSQSALEGELGRLRRPDGGISTELSVTITDPRVNSGSPSNIPLLIKDQRGVDRLLLGEKPTGKQVEIAIKRAQERISSGQTLPFFTSISEAENAAKKRSSDKNTKSAKRPVNALRLLEQEFGAQQPESGTLSTVASEAGKSLARFGIEGIRGLERIPKIPGPAALPVRPIAKALGFDLGQTTGDLLQKIADKKLSPPKEGVAATIGQAIGGIAPSFILGATVGLPATIAAFGAANFGRAVDEAEKAGLSDEKSFAFAAANAGLAPAEAIPVGRTLAVLNRGTGGLVTKMAKKAGVKTVANILERIGKTKSGRALIAVLEAAPEEAAQEAFLSQVPENVLAKAFGVDPERGAFEGVGRAALLGAIGGGIGAGAISPFIQQGDTDAGSQNQIQETSGAPSVQGQPTQAQTEGQAQAGTEVGQGEGRPPQEVASSIQETAKSTSGTSLSQSPLTPLVQELADTEAVRDVIPGGVGPIPIESSRQTLAQINPDTLHTLPAIPGRSQPLLPGGKQAGGTIITQTTAEELVATTSRAARSSLNAVRGLYDVVQRNLLTASDFISRQGEFGPGLSSSVKAVDLRSSQRAKEAELDLRNTLKGLDRTQRQLVARTVNSRPGTENVPDFIRARADRMRQILDETLLFPAQELGFTRDNMPLLGSGRAFPQMPNKKGLDFLKELEQLQAKSPRVYDFARRMVENGQASSIDDALAQLNRYFNQRLRGTVPYLERTRVELAEDMVEWDSNVVLPGLLERTSRVLEGAREWGGPDMPNLHSILMQMKQDTDPAVVERIESFITHELGVAGQVPRTSQQLAGFISNYETLVRLGGSLLSAFRNTGQRFVNTVDYPLPVIARATKDFPPFLNPWIKSAQRIKDAIERTGVVRSVTELGNVEAGIPGERLTTFALKPFTKAETGNQVTTALIARYGVERDLKRLLKLQGRDSRLAKVLDIFATPFGESKAAIERRLGRRGLDVTNQQLADRIASGEQLTLEEIQEAMNRMVLDTQFALTMATKPLWWSNNPWKRLLFKFKTFGIRQTGLIYNTVLKEAFKGNLAPLTRFTAYTILAGELYNILRDILVGDEESLTFRMINRPDERNPKDIALRMLADMIDGGGVGIMADMTFGLGSFAGGPVLSTLENVGERAMDIINRPSGPQLLTTIRKFFEEEVAVTRQANIANRLDKAILNENNDIMSYRVWRDRARSFQDKIEGEDTVKALLIQTIDGFEDFRRTDRTLLYEYAARQISQGDTKDAADYLGRILEGEAPDDQIRIVQGMLTSRDKKAPFGAIARKNRKEFIKAFSSKNRREGVLLQKKFNRDYNRAIKIAASKNIKLPSARAKAAALIRRRPGHN